MREGQLGAFGFFCIKNDIKRLKQGPVMTGEVELEIQPQASRVPIGGANEAPGVIYEQHFRVIKRCRRFIDAAASLDELGIQGARCPSDGGNVVFLWSNDTHIYTTQSTELQGG